jgi:hypothetical protein
MRKISIKILSYLGPAEKLSRLVSILMAASEVQLIFDFHLYIEIDTGDLAHPFQKQLF